MVEEVCLSSAEVKARVSTFTESPRNTVLATTGIHIVGNPAKRVAGGNREEHELLLEECRREPEQATRRIKR